MTQIQESQLGRAYRFIYEFLCGRHPRLRPWHFQYLDTFYTYKKLIRLLPNYAGTVLDVGCGEKPYRSFFGCVDKYIGIDTVPGPKVDIIIDSNESWPIPDESVDVVLCTQVLEHVDNLDLTLSEIRRVLRPHGKAIISVPFTYNEHGAPYDFRRFSIHGAKRFFPEWTVVLAERHGGIGSTLAILLLNWLEFSMNRRFFTRFLKALLLPIWIVISFSVNFFGLVFDFFDKTDSFYNNVLVVFEKRH